MAANEVLGRQKSLMMEAGSVFFCSYGLRKCFEIELVNLLPSASSLNEQKSPSGLPYRWVKLNFFSIFIIILTNILRIKLNISKSISSSESVTSTEFKLNLPI